MRYQEYEILETDSGPMVSHSRVSVYDVMLANEEGQDIFQICVNYNLSPVQIQIALDYIEQNRDQLAQELKEILLKKAQRERDYRAQEAKIREQIAQKPMTQKRAAFYTLREKNRQLREKSEHANYSQ